MGKLRDKEKLKQALQWFKEADALRDKAYNLAQEFSIANTPYRPGDKLIVERGMGNDYVKVQSVSFDIRSKHPAKIYLNCSVWTKDWKRTANRRANVSVNFRGESWGYQITKHIPKDEKAKS